MPIIDPNSPGSLAFRCPICRSAFFTHVTVKKADGQDYKTQFNQCAGCSVMFLDAVKFTRFEPYALPAKSEAQHRSEEHRLRAFHKDNADGRRR